MLLNFDFTNFLKNNTCDAMPEIINILDDVDKQFDDCRRRTTWTVECVSLLINEIVY